MAVGGNWRNFGTFRYVRVYNMKSNRGNTSYLGKLPFALGLGSSLRIKVPQLHLPFKGCTFGLNWLN
jgi:hypothetical protein